MKKIQPPFAKPGSNAASFLPSDALLCASVLPRLGESWLMAGDIDRHSERTTTARRELLGKLYWFFDQKSITICDTHALRQFLHYVTHGHKEPGGRWGNPRMTRPTTPGTVKTYHRILRTFFGWCMREGEVAVSPMERVSTPVDRPDQVHPFTQDQLRALLLAAKRSRNPRRDEAILLLLLDSGLRASELCDLRCDDIDLHASTLVVREGKGGKGRMVPFSRDTKRALYQYLNERTREEGAPLFLSDRGAVAGDALTRHGLRFLIGRLGKVARVEGARLSPHTFRHTFAIEFLRAGGNVYSLMTILGHTNLSMTMRYVNLAQADVAAQHMKFSPVARLKGTK